MEAILGRCKSEFALSAVNALVGWRQESLGVYLPLKTHFSGCHSENMGRRPSFRRLSQLVQCWGSRARGFSGGA